MANGSSALDIAALAEARAMLTPPAPRERVWPVLAAAAFFALSALAFATAMVLAPPVVSDHTARSVGD